MRTRLAHAVLACALGFFSGSAAFANPTGASIANGQATFSRPDPSTLHITNSPGAIINWQQFSIGAGETTRFLQNSAASAILNRVTSQNPSALLGRLLSNGRVFLINRNGIVFGPNAVIDTAGLVASTLNITDQNFISQNLKFQGDRQSGAIENQGYVKVGADGNIFLIAPNITNSGIIETHGGQLVLAAGESVSLVSLDSDNIVFDVQAPENEVVNLGTLLTHGGAANMFAGTIRHSGNINADSIRVDSQGRIQLLAQADVEIEATSTMSASGPMGGTVTIGSTHGATQVSGRIEAKGADQNGGRVHILGEQVALLDTARLDVSGDTGGGEVLVGGDYQGNNLDVHNATMTQVGMDTHIHADAIRKGNGGKVIVWADDYTAFKGNISARGGSHSGDGGFVEVSGKHVLEYAGYVDLRAPAGESGTLLLDPKDITVNSGTGGAASNLLFTATPGSNSIITNGSINAALASGSLILEANNDFLLSAGADINVSAAGSGGNLTIRAGRSASFNANVTTDGGNLTVTANATIASGAVDANRDPGAASIVMADATTLNVGTGNLRLIIDDDAAKANNTSGNMTLENLIAQHIELVMMGSSNGSSILRTSSNAEISATSLWIDHFPNAGGPLGLNGSVGTQIAPLIINVSNISAHTHHDSPGVFLQSTNDGVTTVGGTFFGQGMGVTGLETLVDGGGGSGDIELRSKGTIKVIDDVLALGSAVVLEAGTDGTGDLIIDVQASLADTNANDGGVRVQAGNSPSNTDPMLLSGENVVFQGANTSASFLDVLLRGTGTMTITATADIALLASKGAVSVKALEGAQNISAGGGLNLSGGTAATADTVLQAQTGQIISALFVDVIGAAGDAIVDTNAGLQDINTSGKNIGGLNEGILVDATGAGVAAIHSDGTQDITVLNSDLVRVDGSVGNADITSAGAQSLALTGSGLNALEIGAANAAGASLISGNQTITAGIGLETGSITLRAGNTGTGDATLSSIASQVLSTTGNLTALGGSGSGASSSWTVNGDLSANIAGLVNLTAGSGNNAGVDLMAGSISQFNVGGAMTIQAGTNISADIDVISNGAFNLMTGANLDVTGTASDFADARLSANGPFVINVGGDFNITGGNGNETDANVKSFSGGTLTANITGALNMIANNGLNADVELEADGLLKLVTGTGLTIQGGGGSGAFSEIVSQAGGIDASVTGNANLTAGGGTLAEANIIGETVLLNISGGGLNMTGGGGQDAETEIRSNSGSVDITSTGSVILTGGIGNASVVNADDGTQAQIKANTSLSLSTGADLRLLAGSGSDADADIKTNTGTATINVTGKVDVVGNGVEADAEITSENDLNLTTGGDLNLMSAGGSNSDATIESKSGAVSANIGGALKMLPGSGSGADVEFEADTSFVLTVGTNMTLDAISGGLNSFIFLGMTNADIAALPTSPLTITTGGNMFLRGGVQNGTAIDLQGAITTLDIGGNLDLIAGSAPSTSVEIDQATTINIDVGGTLNMKGGSNTDTAALIGENNAGATVTIGKNAPVGGAITLTGGAHVQGLAVIGTTCVAGCPANVLINGGADVNLTNLSVGEAFIGSLNQSTGSVTVKVGLSGAGFPRLLGSGKIVVDGPITLEALIGNASINFSGEVDSGLGTLMATSLNNLNLDEITGGRLVLKSNTGNINVTTNLTIQARAIGLAPGTRAIDIQAPAGRVILEPDDIGDDMAAVSGDIFIFAAGELELDNGDNGVVYRTPGNLTLISTGGRIEAEADAKLFGRNIILSAATWVDTGQDITATGFVDIDAATSFVLARDIVAVGNINVDAGSSIDLSSATSLTQITLNTVNGSPNVGFTNGSPDLVAPILNINTQNGVALEIDVDNLTINNTVAGNVNIIETSAALNANSVLNSGRPVTIEVKQGPLAIGAINGSVVTLLPATGAGLKSITDANGSAHNITATSLSFTAPNGFGTFADPLEINVTNPFTVDTTLGEIGIIQSVNLRLLGDPNTTGNIRLGATGGQLLIQDQTLTSSAGAIRLSGGSVKVAALGAPTLVDASGDLQVVNTGALIVQASNTTPSATAKLMAGTGINITAGTASVLAGDADFATASIDPAVLNMSLSGDLNIAGGAGYMSEAQIAAATLNLDIAGNTNLSGGAGDNAFATLNAFNGNVSLISSTPALPGTVTLTPGTGLNSDAVIFANSGSGLVTIHAGSCINCTVLGADPFIDPASQAGIFASFAFTQLLPLADPGTIFIDATDQVIVTDENFSLVLLLLPGEQDENEEDDGKRLLMCR